MKNTLKFKIGRGGRFNNQGHLTFLGYGDLDNEISEDCFLRYENQENLSDEVIDQLDYNIENDKEIIEKYNLGSIEVHDTGSIVMEDYVSYLKTGIGTLDFDGEYNTVFTEKVENIVFDTKKYNRIIENAQELTAEDGMIIFDVEDEETWNMLLEQNKLEDYAYHYNKLADLMHAEFYEKESHEDWDFEFKDKYYAN